jgi:hypothetical protein
MGPNTDLSRLAEKEDAMAGSDRPRHGLTLLGPLAGIASAVLWTIGQSWPTTLPGAPTGSAGTDYAAFYANSRGAHMGAALVFALGILCLICFFGALRRVLADCEGWPGGLAATAFGAGMVACALSLASTAFPMAAVSATEPLEPGLARMLWELGNAIGNLAAIPLAVLLGAVAGIAWKSGRLPRWYGLASAAVAVVMLVPLVWWLSFKLFLFWLLAVSISLLRHRDLQASNSPYAPVT